MWRVLLLTVLGSLAIGGGVRAENVTPTITAPLATPSAAADGCEPIDAGSLDAPGEALVIGQINVRAADLFDLSQKGQGSFVHAAVNGLHLVTRERTILAVLPFASGDAYSAEALAEAERLLRSRRYLHDASIRPVLRCGDAIDIEVHTVDNWTLTPSVSVGTAGGQTRYAVEIQDLNLLGLGKTFKLTAQQDGDLAQTTFLYGDENVFGTHVQAFVELDDSDLGETYAFSTGLPFYSQATRRSWWLRGLHDNDRVASRLAAMRASEAGTTPADIDTSLFVVTDRLDLGASRRVETDSPVFASIGAGLRLDRQQSEQVGSLVEDAWLHDQDERYPYLTLHWESYRWDERHNFHSLRKTEDIRTGNSASLELGLLLEGFGNASDAVRLDLDLARSWYSSRDTLQSLTFGHTQYFDAEDDSRRVLRAHYQLFHWLNPDNQVDLRVGGQLQRGYSAKYDLSIGGADGLRAYPTDFEMGDRRWIAAGEFRHINRWAPMSLVNTAFTVFAEAGQAWYDDADNPALADAGIGLLLSPTRGTRASLTRFDIAFPLTERDDVGSYQMYIGSQINF